MNSLKRVLRYDLPLHFVLLLTNWLPDLIIFIRLRGYLASFFLGSCGKDFRLGRNITFYNPKNISIGNNVYIAYGNWFSAGEKIILEDEVVIGPYNVFASSNHTKDNGSFRYGKSQRNPIKVGFGTWIGAQCTITAGVEIGSGALVSANSTVLKNVDNNTLVGGSPAKKIKDV